MALCIPRMQQSIFHSDLCCGPQACSWIYNEREDAWPTSPTEFCLVTPRSDACAAAIDGKIYVAGERQNCVSVVAPAALTDLTTVSVSSLPRHRALTPMMHLMMRANLQLAR